MPTFDASGLDDLPRAALGNLLVTVGEFVVVGKVAIDVVARGMARLPPDRLTRDVDVAISVGSDAAPAVRDSTNASRDWRTGTEPASGSVRREPRSTCFRTVGSLGTTKWSWGRTTSTWPG